MKEEKMDGWMDGWMEGRAGGKGNGGKETERKTNIKGCSEIYIKRGKRREHMYDVNQVAKH